MTLEPQEWLTAVVSFAAGTIGAYFTFRLKLERFFGRYEERERQKDERWAELMRRIGALEGTLRHRRIED